MFEQIAVPKPVVASPRHSASKPAGRLVSDARYLRYVNILRFALPITLFVVYTGFELFEHGALLPIGDMRLVAETSIFGLLGPLLVFTWLSYLGVLMKKVHLMNRQMANMNQTLEEQVQERTETLAQRNAELAHVNRELAQKNQELRQLDQLKSDFVALVSHELRAPLTNLNGALEMTLNIDQTMPATSRRMLHLMAGESARLTRFVQTILDVSRLEAGKIKFDAGPVAVTPLLRRCAETTFGLSPRSVHWRIQHDLPPAWVDEAYLEEIVRNLLVNVEKYTPAGSPVEIGVDRQPANCDLLQDRIRISVTDYGPGIPVAEQAHIFERFHRHTADCDQTMPGWGLGLYFARALTEAQGGTLTVTSPVMSQAHVKEFPGARFVLDLPMAEETPEE